MNKLHLSNIKGQVISCLQAYIVEVILGLCFFIMYMIGNISSYSDYLAWRYIPAMFPSLFVITYSFNYLFRGKKRVIYYLSLLTLIPLLLLSGHLGKFVNSAAFGFTLLLTAFVLLGFRKAKDNRAFASHSVEIVVNLLFAFFVGMLLMGVITAIFHSINYIFDLNISIHVIETVFRFILFIFIPLLFCSLQQEQEEKNNWQTLPGIVQFVLNFILSPGIILYTGILYVYFISILARWDLPKGGVAYMVMAFIAVSLVGKMAQLIVSQKYYEWFYRSFGYLAIPPLILFWVGTAQRICDYGLTELRIYLLAAGILMSVYIFLLQSKRLCNYRAMLLISSVAIILLTYIPGVSARSLGILSQSHRMKQLALELSLWDTATGKLIHTDIFKPKDSLQTEKVRQLNSSYEYLIDENSKKEVVSQYGKNNLDEVLKVADIKYYQCPVTDLSVVDYQHYLAGCRLFYDTENMLNVKQNEHLLLKINMNEHFAKYKEEMGLWNKEALAITPFCLKNDSCLVVVKTIIRDRDGNYEIEQSDDLVVFCK